MSPSVMSKRRYASIVDYVRSLTDDTTAEKVATHIQQVMNYDPNASTYNEKNAQNVNDVSPA
jgi:hypothetical protein